MSKTTIIPPSEALTVEKGLPAAHSRPSKEKCEGKIGPNRDLATGVYRPRCSVVRLLVRQECQGTVPGYLHLIVRNLLRNRRRTVLTVFSMTVSLFLLGILLSVYAVFYQREPYGEQALRLVTRHRVSFLVALPEYYGERIRAVEGVEEVCIFTWFGGVYIDRRPEHMLPLVAVESDKIFRVRTESTLPPEQLAAFVRDRQGLALGRAVANRLGLKLGQRLTVQGDVYPVDLEFVVRAIYEGPDDIDAYFHWQYLQESLPRSYKGQVTAFSVRARTPQDVSRIAQAVDQQFRNAQQPTRTESEKAFMVSFIGMIGNIKLFLLSIAGAIVFTILLVAANTMAMSVRERIREIGVLKTLGFSSTSVLAMIMCESAIIAVLGGLFGVTLSYLATQALANEIVMYIQGFTMPLWGIPICMAVALILGLLSSLIPAAVAARITIADALRHTG